MNVISIDSKGLFEGISDLQDWDCLFLTCTIYVVYCRIMEKSMFTNKKAYLSLIKTKLVAKSSQGG